ncbi:MAG TPA: hypothetical protein VHE33_04885 [Acidobacteriaceae bacterium]|nr:hypothetical protein [Acidobacteriaceae bacterium]
MTRASLVERQARDLSPPASGPDPLHPARLEHNPLDSDPRWHLAQRVVASRHFVRSALLSRFLIYIVGETLCGRAEAITEHAIGVRVFDRPADYRTVEDNIVRNYARQLRRRLADYFAEEGSAEPLHIDIPLGGYVPAFIETAAKKLPAPDVANDRTIPIRVLPEAAVLTAAEPIPTRRFPRGVMFGALFALYTFALVAVVWFAALRLHAPSAAVPHPSVAAEDTSPAAPLWAALFRSDMNTWIVPADAGLNLLEDLSRRPIPLADYISGGAARLALPAMDAHSADDLRSQRFTSFVDLETITALARLPQFNPERAQLRFPRDLRLDDIRNANAIVLGSVSSNPWAAMAETSANFRIVLGPGMQGARIVNAHPLPGEAETYVSHWNEPDHETFAVISCFPNLSGNGHILVLQGLDVAGTQAAAEALLHPTAIAPILKEATRADGSLRAFEILLRSTSIQSAAARTSVVGSRVE